MNENDGDIICISRRCFYKLSQILKQVKKNDFVPQNNVYDAKISAILIYTKS